MAIPSLQVKQPEQKKQLSTGHRVLIIIGCIIALPLLAFIIYVVVQFSALFSLMDTVTKEVDIARTEHIEKVNEKRLDNATYYINQGVIKDTKPTYSSVVDACYLAHNDSGWIAQSHYQECYIRYIDVFETDITDDQYVALVQAGQSTTTQSSDLKALIKTCASDRRELGSPEDTVMGYTSANGSPAQCNLPQETYGDRVVLYAVRGIVSEQTTTGDRSKITGERSNIIMVGDYAYYKKDIGCKPIALFCESPYSSPLVGTMKQKNN